MDIDFLNVQSSGKLDKKFDGIIIPKKSVFEISKLLEDYNQNVKINFSKTRIKTNFW